MLQELSSLKSTGHNLDGIVSRKQQSQALAMNTLAAKPRVPLVSVVKKPVMDIARSAPKQNPSHAPAPATTLMRRAVHKPQIPLKRTVNTVVPLAATTPSGVASHIVPKMSLSHIDPLKQAHAERIAKNDKVQRFQPSHGTLNNAAVQRRVATGTRPKSQQATPVATQDAQRAPRQPLDMFERALQSATAHEQPFVDPQKHGKRVSKAMYSFALACVAVILIGGVYAYKNVGNAKLYLASSTAGFQASLPSYQPPGFGLGALQASAGQVAENFHSTSDSRAFTLTEKPSSWDSDTLRQTFVVGVANQNYQTVESAGRTIYIYGNRNATWVNGGIWYQVRSQGSLSTQQLIQIATSL